MGCVAGRPAYVEKSGEGFILTTQAEDAAYWRSYFDLDCDYESIFQAFGQDPFVRRAYLKYGGLRVLRQPIFETICTFIISANNNEKRIRSIVERLSNTLGERKGLLDDEIFAFPAPEAIVAAGEDFLRTLGLGYRAPYLFAAAQAVMRGECAMSALPEMGYESAMNELLKLKGIGEKVADCILLFSCGYQNAFPVDTWVKKVMKGLYQMEGSAAKIRRAGMLHFGGHAGIVQQVLFHGARNGLFPELAAPAS